MAEFTNANTVSVAAGQNVPLTETAVAGKGCVVHREGAGIVTLRGITNQCKARFKVGFGANVAIPTGGTVEAITAALSINGEPLNSASATVTPAAVENYFNIYVTAFVEVPREYGREVLEGMKNAKIKGRSVNMEPANQK